MHEGLRTNAPAQRLHACPERENDDVRWRRHIRNSRFTDDVIRWRGKRGPNYFEDASREASSTEDTTENETHMGLNIMSDQKNATEKYLWWQ
jgi:hypothetical protein